MESKNVKNGRRGRKPSPRPLHHEHERAGRQLGGGKIAYIKVMTADEAKQMFPAVEGIPAGIDLFALHAADGTPIGTDRQPPGCPGPCHGRRAGDRQPALSAALTQDTCLWRTASPIALARLPGRCRAVRGDVIFGQPDKSAGVGSAGDDTSWARGWNLDRDRLDAGGDVAKRFGLGIDVGGTFTDIVVSRRGDRPPGEPQGADDARRSLRGVMVGIDRLLQDERRLRRRTWGAWCMRPRCSPMR